jgi:cold shock CspA family protein/ribosome-associated translation inhibitor RaiA
MKLPLEITFSRMEPSVALESRVRTLASRLDKFSTHIMRCHVVIEAPGHHSHQGGLFDIHLDITVPGKEIAIRRAHPETHSHEDAYVALRDVFRAARRKLEDYERKRRLDVKTHVQPLHGRIFELDPDRHFGRIETDDGRLIYFHSHSVHDRRFDQLAAGMNVRFAEEAGDSGPQASVVELIP